MVIMFKVILFVGLVLTLMAVIVGATLAANVPDSTIIPKLTPFPTQ